jgi:membrane protease YdiL (CAAX protease family)
VRVVRFAAAIGLQLLLVAHRAAPSPPSLPPPGELGSHESYVEALRQANAALADELLARYERRIAEAPHDAVAAVERCRFLAAAFYDAETDENPREAERVLCVEDVDRRFWADPATRVFVIEGRSGEEARAAGEEFLASPPPGTGAGQLAAVHAHLARALENDDEARAARHAAQAMELDSSLDLLVLRARERIAAGEPEVARSFLMQDLLETRDTWTLEQKAALLADLEDFDAVLSAFGELERRGAEPFRRDVLARALVGSGLIDAARAAYAEAAAGWQSDEALRERFEFELAHGDADSARASYDALRARGWESDPFGRDRFTLLLAHPDAPWRWEDASGLALLAFVAFVIALLPALWILPVAWVGLSRQRGLSGIPSGPDFGLHHAWLVCALYLLAEGLAFVVNPDVFSEAGGNASTSLDRATLARYAVVSFVAGVAVVLLTVRRRLGELLGPGVWSWKRTLASGVGAVVALRVGLWMVLQVVGGGDGDPVTERILRSVNDRFGLDVTLVLVALFVPVTEEIVFRGVLLSAFSRHLSPRWANLAQATLFGLAHAHLLVTPFAFAMGLVAGRMTRRSGTLRPALLMHVLNNAIACVVLAALGP